MVSVFPDFKGKSLNELKSMPRVRSHGTHTLLAFTGVLLNIENEAVTSELLADLKRDHEKFQPSITAEAYKVHYLCSLVTCLPETPFPT